MLKIITLIPLLALACTLTAAPAQTTAETSAAIKPAQLAQLATAQTAIPANCTVIALKTLNLRAMAGTSSPVIAILKHGDQLTILPDPPQGNWIHVQAQDHTGWINSNYCKGQ